MRALAGQCTQQCSDEKNFADSGEMYSGVISLGLVLALVLVHEKQENRPQHLTMYGRLTKFLSFTISSVAHGFNTPRGTWRMLVHENPY